MHTSTQRTIMQLTVLVSVFLLCFLLPFYSINAQSQSAETINVKPVSQFYEPNSQIEIEVVSRLINLNDKQTTWNVNGNVVETGFGVKSITVPTGTQANPTTVRFKVVLPTEGTITRTLTLRPIEVDLVWESDQSYTPPFFKGKSLNPGWGEMTVTAIPHIYKSDGSKYSKEDLVYRWEYNGIVYGDDSGRGKNSITVNATPRNNRMSVEIEEPNGEIVARDFVNFPRAEPEIVFYEESPNRGVILAQSFSNTVNLSQSSNFAITAQPYYFLAENSQASNLNYNWAINGSTVEQTPKDAINLNMDQVTNKYNVSVEITDSNNLLFPETQENVEITF